MISFSKPFFFSFKGFWKVGNDIVLRTIEKKYFNDVEYSKSSSYKLQCKF